MIITMSSDDNMKVEYKCDICNYITSKKSNINNHNVSLKHLRNVENSKKDTSYNNSNNEEVERITRHYDDMLTWYKEQLVVEREKNRELFDVINRQEERIKSLEDKNEKQMEEIKELYKNQIVERTRTNPDTVEYESFHLDRYLKETCKDAISIGEFVESINITEGDCANYIREKHESITGLTLRELKRIGDVVKMPFQCVDMKRKIMYVKRKGEWIHNMEMEHEPLYVYFSCISGKINGMINSISRDERLKMEFLKKYDISEDPRNCITIAYIASMEYMNTTMDKGNCIKYLDKLNKAICDKCKVCKYGDKTGVVK